MLSIILIMLSYYFYFLTVDKSYKSKKKKNRAEFSRNCKEQVDLKVTPNRK